MASPTKKVTIVRERKASTKGAARKNKIRRLGTTAPNLPLNKPNANELAQGAKKAAKTAVVATKAAAAKPAAKKSATK